MDRPDRQGGRHRARGGSLSDPAVEAAAVAASLGIDPMGVLALSDPADIVAVNVALGRGAEIATDRLAIAVGRLFQGKGG